MEKDKEKFPIQTYSNKELAGHYRVSTKTFKRYLTRLKTDLGPRLGNSFSPKQVKIIVEHLGKPFIWIAAAFENAFASANADHGEQTDQDGDGLGGKK